ncbi:DUF4238 domain-containing protein [Photorhabdus luminescens]|uniref:DUF4238 domain-containing protein n=1 Tax=Photorhabdus luminescens subsp. sonorensis TaxID=1173677 RepID=A0A5C4RGY4_PHOLU|nr:DUF4238 domain-containing protein [Photorhabdus luminescens]TNH43048.1 DUF4238 domain-containing protein [Photorhabdus luminescens subsp. sonorensis]
MQYIILIISDNINGEPILINKIREFSKNHWWFIHCFFGINLGYDLYTNKSYEKKIIRNQTSLPFITSDHPVININPLGDKSEYIDYYYPISTEFALLVTSSDHWKSIKNNITYDVVDFLNKEICENSGDTIYSNSKDIIERYKKDFNKRKIITYFNNKRNTLY